MNEDSEFLPGFAIGVIIGMLILGSMNACSNSSVRQQAIDHGYARYHPTTGEWEWIENNINEQGDGEP